MSSLKKKKHLKNSERQRKKNKENKENILNFEEVITIEETINMGRVDPLILISLIILVTAGVIMVFSASYYVGQIKYGDVLYFLKRQGAFASLGFAVLPLIIKLDWRVYKKFSKMLYIVSCLLLVAVLILGEERNNAKRWLELGPITFQPSEVAKVGLILYLSSYIVDNDRILDTWTGFIKCCIVIAIPTGLVLIENTSTAIIMGIIGMSILFVASPTILYFIPFVLVSVLGLVGILVFGQGFRMARIEAWLDPFAEGVSDVVGFQIVQSLYAIASGGFFGLGIGQSRQKLGFIPEAQNDIIFAVICEELGLVGSFVFVFLFATIIWRGYIVAIRSPRKYMSYSTVGIITMIAVQVIINIAVVTNSMPNTGIPLPFVSYGGTALLIMMGSAGLVLNFSRYFN